MADSKTGWIAAGVMGIVVLLTGGCCLTGGLLFAMSGGQDDYVTAEPAFGEPSFGQPPRAAFGHMCNSVSAGSACSEYPAGSDYVGLLGEPLAQEVCSAGGGAWGAACPHAGKVGSCIVEGSTIHYYSHGAVPFNVYTARSACQSGMGVFLPSY